MPNTLAIDMQLPQGWVEAALSGRGFTRSKKDDSTTAKDPDVSLSRQQWSGMRLVDTVKLDSSEGAVETWVFTTKSGHIASKKRAQDRAKVVDRFERFALANPNNQEGYVALVEYCNGRTEGHRVAIDKADLREAMLGSRVPEQLRGATLQCYLRPFKGMNSFLRASYCREDETFSLVRVTPLYRSTQPEDSVEANDFNHGEIPITPDNPEDTKLLSGSRPVLKSLVNFLQRQLPDPSSQIISKCDIDLVVDDNGELWLVSIPNVTMRESNNTGIDHRPPDDVSSTDALCKIKSVTTTADYSNDDGGTTSVLSHIPPIEGVGNSLGSARLPSSPSRRKIRSFVTESMQHEKKADSSALEKILPDISISLGTRSAQGDHRDSKGKRGKSVYIFEFKDGVYVAKMHASALRGLCGWREVCSVQGEH